VVSLLNKILSDDEDRKLLLSECEQFVRKHAISDSTFGVACANDEHFLYDLRDERKVGRPLRKAVRDYMKLENLSKRLRNAKPA
jgi:hypothetical protein